MERLLVTDVGLLFKATSCTKSKVKLSNTAAHEAGTVVLRCSSH